MPPPTQPKPEFSGDWQLNTTAFVLNPMVAAAVQRGTPSISRREPVFTVALETVLGDTPLNAKFELSSDGPLLRWEGNGLVATFEEPGPNGEVTMSFRYELSGEGRLHVTEAIRGAGRDQDTVWVYDRRR